jgi:hypothetical protein
MSRFNSELNIGISIAMLVCVVMNDIAAGAQTERRGGAGPVRGLLGGKVLTGRFCPV